MKDLYTLIMAGGSGTRFWPRSKTAKPKQYLNIFGDDSLLQDTIKRFATFTENENIYIVSSKTQAAVLEEQTTMLPKENLIYEPVGRNTLPCIGLAAMFAEKENPDGIMVVSPSDHLIENNELFKETVLAAAKIADEKDADTVVLENDLAANLAMKVSIDHKEGGNDGAITISYKTLEQLDALCQLLSSRPLGDSK